MKKTLIALAAIAATSAFAQSNVTLYGIVDVGYANKSWTDTAMGVSKSSGVQDGVQAGNRLGFRGTEDLGSGLKAEFVVEFFTNPTGQTATNYRALNTGAQIDGMEATASNGNGEAGKSATSLNRQSFAGLTGGFGTVRAGYQYTNSYELATWAGYNLVNEGVEGGGAHLNGVVGGIRATGLTYISPNFGGVTVRAQYGAGTAINTFESTINGTSNQERVSLMGQYANGPLSAAIAYTTYKTEAVVGTLTTGFVTAASAAATAKLTQIGGSYDFGVAKVGATYNVGDNGAATLVTNRSSQVGVTAPVGKGVSLIAGIGRSYLQTDSTGAKTSDIENSQIGVTYDFSKRTQVYAFWGQTKDNGTAATAWDTKTETIAGIRHSF